MAEITFEAADGGQETVEAVTGMSVMENAVQNGISGIIAECGGALACSTCHVYVDTKFLGQLPAMSEFENEMLDETACPRATNSRLSCQIPVAEELNGLLVRIPEAQL
jgi:2Fe-2S ferredoxin